MQGGDAQIALAAAGTNPMSGNLEEPDHSSSNWYFSREEIEKNSPSRKDGIDLRKETYFRKSYCTFLQELGIRLKVPQVTIATAIVFSHRFFLRQSHARNDRYMVATICMFIAGKVEETPRPLRDVIWLSYENRFKKDPAAVQRIKQKEVYETEKERVLLGERLVLTTLGFDLNIHHPYKPLVTAIKKFNVAANTLAQVAWNFVNDGLRTSLCLQFKPHHIAAGAIFLAAKFLKVKLPAEGDKAWWQEFEVNPRQLEEVSNQMLELYEQNKSATGSRMSDPSSSAGPYHKLKAMAASQAAAERAPGTSPSGPARPQAMVKSEHQEVKISTTQVVSHVGTGEVTEAKSSLEDGEDIADSKPKIVASRVTVTTTATTTTEVTVKTAVSANEVDSLGDKATESKMDATKETKGTFLNLDEVNTDKVKAAMEKRRRCRAEGQQETGGLSVKKETTDEEELLERELESGVEVAAEAEKATKHGRHESKGKPVRKVEHESVTVKDIVEEGEVSVISTVREYAGKEDEEGEIKMEFPHGAENEAAPGKREQADDGEVATAAKRRRGFGGADDSGSDRKKSREHGEWAGTSRSERSPGPVEEGELPSANEALEEPLSPHKPGDKRSHASAGPNRGATSPETQRRHNQTNWEHGGSTTARHRDGRYGGRDQSSHHQSSSSFHSSHPSYRQSGYQQQQQRAEGDHEWRYHGDKEYVDSDHKKMRHEYVY